MNIIPVITTAGLAAVFNATSDGLSARITHIALGDAAWSPGHGATALQNERHRIAISSGSRVETTQIHLTAIENGAVEYWVREIGFILEDGTLLAVWSDPDQALAFKAKGVDLLLAFDLVLSALPADSVIVEGTGGLSLAPATNTVVGVARFATEAEALAGLLDSVSMTPRMTRSHGDARYARVAHAHAWEDITGKPSTFSPKNHQHPWSSIMGKPGTFPPSTHNHDTRYSRVSHLHDDRYPTKSHGHDSRYARLSHNHDETYARVGHTHGDIYLELADFRMVDGWTRTNNRRGFEDYQGYNDWESNYADVFPPSGFTMDHLRGFIASPAIIFFSGDVNRDDHLWCRWRARSDRVRIICANSENRGDASGASSYVNYLGFWRK